MKKRFIIIAAVIGLLASCSNPADNSPGKKPENPDHKTLIVFDNTQGICTVSVYDDYRRQDDDKIAEVPAGRLSAQIEYTPGASVPFYFSYAINLKGISGFRLNYVPEIGKDQKAVRIDAGITTTITIPKLDETLSSPDTLLSTNSYILIQNNSSYSFQLHRGTSILSPDNTSIPLVNSGERAQYTINPGAASPYQLLVGADYKAFPGSIVSFEAGRVYSFVFDGNISLTTEVEIKLENVAGSSSSNSGPETPGAPAVTAADGLLTLRWTAVQGAEQYEVYLSTTGQPPSSPEKTVAGTTTVLTGLTNKTVYYMWIKAVNSSGSSDFSPYSRGIPWPLGEVPAAPERPVIIPGINQLTVNWEECGGADSYEVYINTTVTSPSAPEITTDKTSAVIKNLENDKIYYIWVRAVNSAGKSNYSPLEAGTPTIPTIAPSTPSRPVLTAGNRELAVSWQAVELAASYEVWLGTSDNSAQAQKRGGDISGGVTETVISGLENETVYYVWIKAKNSVGTSGFSLSASAKPSAFAVLPETPSLPTVTAGNRELSVSWQSVEGALSYEVWTGTTNNSASAQKNGGDVSGTSVMLAGLTNEITYYIWIKAKNNIGVSEFSPRASGTPSAFAAVPSAPQAAPAVIAGSGQLTVSWQAVEGANSYEVWAGTDTNPTLATKRGGDVSGLSSVITGLNNGTVYCVWIKAKNSVGTSGFSPMASETPLLFTVSPQAPAAPSVSIGNGQITASWSAEERATAYEVWIGTANNSASASKNGSDITTSLSVTIESLSNGTTYYIWIKAKNNIGTSGFSPAASGKPIANATAPTLSASNGQLTATWTAIAGADQYDVFCGSGINPPENATQTVTGTSVTINSLVNGTTYNVWVRGKNSTGTGIISAAASAKPVGNMGTVTVSTGNGQLTASWSAVDGADQYDVYYGATSTIPGSSSQTVSTTAATIGSLTNGTTYYVWVKPMNATGTGNANTVVSGVPMATPGSLTVSAGNQQITVNWAAVPGASSYEVYYGTTTTIPSAASFTGTGTSRIISGLSNGTEYYFWVKAVNANGTSGASPMANGTPLDAQGELTVSAAYQQITISWSSIPGATGYEVYYSTTATIPTTASFTITELSKTITGLSNGTTYYFWVKAINANGTGEASPMASGKPIDNMGTVTLTTGGNGELKLSWSSVIGADEYEVYRNSANSIPASPSLTVATTTATISGLTNGTTYYVWVKPKNANGKGTANTAVSGKPIGSMGTVSLVSGNGQLTASWSTVAGADEYEVYRNTSNSIPASPSQTISTTTVTFSSLTNGTMYYVWVKGKNTTGTGNASTAVNGKPLGTPGTPILTPVYKQLLVTWTAVAGADEYEVYYGTGTPTTLVTTTARTTATIGGLTSGTTYYVRLRAKNANGISDYGSSISSVTNDDIPVPGLYRGAEKIGTQNLAASLTYISSNAVSGDNFYIVLGADESSSPNILNYSGKTVRITLLGYSSERKITLNANGRLFDISSGVTLIFGENISLVGRSTNNNSLVYLNNGNLFMNNGAKISGNTANGSDGGGVYVANGTFTMSGGEISGNTATIGGGVFASTNGGTFTMIGGKIIGNIADYTGGGVAFYSSRTFTMSGGEISGNTAASSGGGVCVANGTFTMSNGIISGNTVSNSTSYSNSSGGGVCIFSNGTFTMSGGTISDNTASVSGSGSISYGGGVYVNSNATFTMSGGTISGNTALVSSPASNSYGGGVYVASNGTFTKSGGGTITGYASDTVNGNVVKNDSGVLNNHGHAVYSDYNSKRRETTAGPTVNLDSRVSGSAGGWE